MSLSSTLITVVADAAPAAAQNAATGAKGQGSMLTFFVPFILIMIVMFFFTSRSQKKQQAKRQEMLNNLMKGSRVVLAGGIYGNIVEVREKTFLVEIADKIRIEVEKSGIAQVISSEESGKTVEAAK
ncbi:MAG: preprotein translocase subunit YajC [Victivallaceae bacterium]|nr:preprotein translocase subunit YajC [Victivallaceae bacterium]